LKTGLPRAFLWKTCSCVQYCNSISFRIGSLLRSASVVLPLKRTSS